MAQLSDRSSPFVAALLDVLKERGIEEVTRIDITMEVDKPISVLAEFWMTDEQGRVLADKVKQMRLFHVEAADDE